MQGESRKRHIARVRRSKFWRIVYKFVWLMSYRKADEYEKKWMEKDHVDYFGGPYNGDKTNH